MTVGATAVPTEMVLKTMAVQAAQGSKGGAEGHKQ